MRVKDPGFWGQLGESVAGSGAGVLEGWIEAKEKERQTKRLESLPQELSSAYELPQGVLKNLDLKSLQAIAVKQAVEGQKKAKKEAETLSDIEKAYGDLSEVEELYDKTGAVEGFRRKQFQSKPFRELTRKANKLRANPYLKSKGIDIPEAGQRGFLESIKEAKDIFADEYADKLPKDKLQPPQVQPSVEPRQTPPGERFSLPSLQEGTAPQQPGMPQQQDQGIGVPPWLKDVGRAAPQVASELFRAATPGAFVSDVVGAAEQMREDALPPEDYMEEVYKNMPPQIAKQARKAYEALKQEKRSLGKEFKVSDWLPTSKNREKIVDAVTDKVFGPRETKEKSDIEKSITRLASAIGMRHGGGTLLTPMSWLRPTISVVGGEIAGEGAEAAGLGKTGRFVASLGFSMFSDPLFDGLRDKVLGNASGIYNKMDEGIKNLASKTPDLRKVSKNALTEMGFSEATPKDFTNQVTKIYDEAKLPQMNLGRVRSYIKGMNEYWYKDGKSELTKTGAKLFKDVKTSLEDTLEKGMKAHGLGKLHNEYKYAKEITNGMKESQFALTTLKKIFAENKGIGRSLWRTLIYAAPEGAAPALLGTTVAGFTGGVAGALTGLGINTLRKAYRFLETPTALKELTKLVPAAFTGNLPVVARQMGILDDMYEKKKK